jgi:hypothetical protein
MVDEIGTTVSFANRRWTAGRDITTTGLTLPP